MAVNFRFKNKTHMAILFMSIATIIFVLHEMLASMSDPLLNQGTSDSLRDARIQQWTNEHEGKDRLLLPSYISQKLQAPFEGEKLVHLDLKGAPPRVAYYKELFPYLQALGATGLLIEYEDMFPYSGRLEGITAYNAYTPSDIQDILQLAEDNNLSVIPLVQTFGHLEFVLKLAEYKDLREVGPYPQVICPSQSKSLEFIEDMVSQVLKLHPKVKYLHIGSDEVYYLGQCDACVKKMYDKQWTKTQLFLEHVKTVAQMVQLRGVRPMMWDDEFRQAPEELIADSGVDKMVDIMVWKYTPDVALAITPDILDKYQRLFPGSLWIASAFKGATGPNKIVTDLRHHMMNHVSWMQLVSAWSDRIKFKGIGITGWQRYDHFAVLCELLPVGLPSLTLSLIYLAGRGLSDKDVTDLVHCDLSQVLSYSSDQDSSALSLCSYPGSQTYHAVHRLHTLLLDLPMEDVARGWFSRYNIEHAFSSPAHVETATMNLDRHMLELRSLEQELRRTMTLVYDDFTIDEWLDTVIRPVLQRILRLREARDLLLEQSVWPRRPLNSSTLVETEAFPFT